MLLEAVKTFGKECRRRPEHGVPAEIGTVLYFLGIITAHRVHGKRISRLDSKEILAGLDWAVAQDWLDAESREWFEKSRERFLAD